MTAVTRGQRIYFAAVGLLALWVGIWGYFIPGRVDQAIPWLVPPLHARFLGAMYLSGTTFMVGSILARYYAEVRVRGTRDRDLDRNAIRGLALLPGRI